MDSAISAARWVVGKALGPVTDGLVEAWAASSELGANVSDLKMELLYAQGMLDSSGSTGHGHGREARGAALRLLLQELWRLASNAEDVLDELDYFRIQDEIYHTYHAAEEHAGGCARNLVLNAGHVSRFAAAKLLGLFGAANTTSPGASPDDVDEPSGERGAIQRVLCCARARPGGSSRRARGGGGGFSSAAQHNSLAASGAHRTSRRSFGKHLSCCCSFAMLRSDTDTGTVSVHDMVQRGESVLESPKLELYRVEMSKRMKDIVAKLKPLSAKVSTILSLELLDSNRAIAHDVAANLGALLSNEEGRALVPPKKTAMSLPITNPEILDPNFVGREAEKARIIDEITRGDSCGRDLTVIPIFGLGGIGKTTLAKHVHKQVENLFDVRVWVCVPVKFTVDGLIKEIAKSINEEGENSDSPRKSIEERLKGLKHKKFFIVLDDMWDCDNIDWNRILAVFPKGHTKGNIIIVTSRSSAVAEIVKTPNTDATELEGLRGEKFWDLFVACVFGDKKSTEGATDELLRIGRDILKKLNGSPLAVKTVGKILSNNLDPDHWTRVLESKEWTLQTSDDDIMPALKLSYDFLPFHLQKCFSYCALFPEDYMFFDHELIYLWIGLDILHCDGQNESIEDIAQSSFNQLVDHGFFKKSDETKNGETCYLIHGLLRDLALKAASHECLNVDRFNVTSVKIRPSIRHLSIVINDEDDTDGIVGENFRSELRNLKSRLEIGNLHTLSFFGELEGSFTTICGDFLIKANALRVLRLPIISVAMESILQNLPALVHLRYLRLENSFLYSMCLPRILSRLYHLRVLDLHDWYGSTDLPKDMSNLKKLSYFLADVDELHSNISSVGGLPFLRELKNFQAKKEKDGFELMQLGKLLELRELVIHNLEEINTKEEAAEAKLIEKKYLQRLTLVWGSVQSNIKPDVQSVVLESLQPHINLRNLCIKGHGGSSCPKWLCDKLCVKALRSLHLANVAWNRLPPLGEMQLVELTLEGISSISEFVLEKSFHRLEMLKLSGLPMFTKWVAQDTVHLFSKLQKLIIENCSNLLGLPFLNTICHPSEQDGNQPWLPNLREFHIVNCPNILSLPPIPWTRSLCSVDIKKVGRKLESLYYTKPSSSSLATVIIIGKDHLHGIDQEVLSFGNLTDLQDLMMSNCPPLELRHQKMLTSLKKLGISNPKGGVLLPLEGSHGDDDWWQLPVEHLSIWSVSGQELTQLLHHLPVLSSLEIQGCQKMTRLGVAAQEQGTNPAQQQRTAVQVSVEVELEEEEEVELDGDGGGLLLLPAHLSSSLRSLRITKCERLQLALVGRPGGEEGIQGLRSLRTLNISDCPKMLSGYSSTSCPFPSSLQELRLSYMKGMATEQLSNLTSLTHLFMQHCGWYSRLASLWPLTTRGQLSELNVHRTPDFFAGWDGMRGMQQDGEEQQQLLLGSSRLQELKTDDFTGVLATPICRLLSPCLTKLILEMNSKVESFTREQEEALQLLTSLQDLQFAFCSKLQGLPAGLHMLTNLQKLQIYACPAIGSVPKDDLPKSLQQLDIHGCDNDELKRQWKSLIGTIPKIFIE